MEGTSQRGTGGAVRCCEATYRRQETIASDARLIALRPCVLSPVCDVSPPCLKAIRYH